MRKDTERQRYKDACTKEIPLFDQKYRYAEAAEAIRIEHFLTKLQFVQPAQTAIEKVFPSPHGKVYLCFLTGTEVLLQIYLVERYGDFLSDYETWSVLSSYLLLVDEDFIHYIYINDYGERIQYRIDWPTLVTGRDVQSE